MCTAPNLEADEGSAGLKTALLEKLSVGFRAEGGRVGKSLRGGHSHPAVAWAALPSPLESWTDHNRWGPVSLRTLTTRTGPGTAGKRSNSDDSHRQLPTAKALAALGPKGNYPELGRGEFFPQGPRSPETRPGGGM